MKQVLCVACGPANGAGLAPDAIEGWAVHKVSSLADARRALAGGDYVVGLLLYNAQSATDDLVDFLREASHLQWVGVFAPHEIESKHCRDLITGYLHDYHTSPIDLVRLGYTLGHAHGWATLGSLPKAAPGQRRSGGSPLVGAGVAMTRLRAQVERVAKVAAPVLIWGESGSGKELTAQAIHAQSSRAAGAFVPINCGAIAPSLIHSELFGYERGAFTGANRAKAGLIESADGGTLFLDEIGDLPKEMQANLLRFLQEKTICRLGSTRAIHVDVRVIAASHVQLQRAVADGAFREDLYYRLAVLPVDVPPLRARRDDLVTLAGHFFHVYAKEKSPRLKGFSQRALDAMLNHAWPGNVRELINRVRRALVMSDGRLITPEDLDLTADTPVPSPALDDSRVRGERSALRECLDRSSQNVSLAARELGISRTTMYRLLNKHSLRA
jgi:DNA-binding NtrC family response regulator